MDTDNSSQAPDSTHVIHPNEWFKRKYPDVAAAFGNALDMSCKGNKNLAWVVKGINENFFASILGKLGSPIEPMVYITTEDSFYQYETKVGIFASKSKAEVIVRISTIMQACAEECTGNYLEIEFDSSPLIFHFGKAAQLHGVIEKAKGFLAESEQFFNAHLGEEHIACKNGMLRLSDRQLLEFSPIYRRRNKIGVNYDPTARCEMFSDVLLNPALSKTDAKVLQQWSGLCLIGLNLPQVIVLLIGEGGTGKGTFIQVLNRIIGQENVEQLRTEHLGSRFETSRYIGKMLLYGADVKANFFNNANVSFLKSLTGGDPLNAEKKGVTKGPKIYGRYLVVVTSNSRLVVNLEGDASAYKRRIIPIEYNRTRPQNVIFDLSDQLWEKEASGILNWMLDGLDELKRQGYIIRLSEEQERSVDDLLLESESPKIFVEECLIADATNSLLAADCSSAYYKYCKNRGWNALPSKEASKQIIECVGKAFGKSQSHDILNSNGKEQRGWKGLRIK